MRNLNETVDLGIIKVELPAFSKMTNQELQSQFDKAIKDLDTEYAFALVQEVIERQGKGST